MRTALLVAVVMLVGCTPAAAPNASVGPSTSAPTVRPTATTAPVTVVPAQSPTLPASPSSTAAQTGSPDAASSPVSGDGLDAVFATLAAVLAPFGPTAARVTTGEDVIAQLEETKAMLDESFHAQINAEIARYQANGLVERGSVSLGTTPATSLVVDRFVSEAGAAADFPIRAPGGSCDEVTLPGAPLADVIAKRCDAPDANDLYVVAHRGDLILTAQALGVPEGEAVEPVIETLADIVRAIEPSIAD